MSTSRSRRGSDAQPGGGDSSNEPEDVFGLFDEHAPQQHRMNGSADMYPGHSAEPSAPAAARQRTTVYDHVGEHSFAEQHASRPDAQRLRSHAAHPATALETPADRPMAHMPELDRCDSPEPPSPSEGSAHVVEVGSSGSDSPLQPSPRHSPVAHEHASSGGWANSQAPSAAQHPSHHQQPEAVWPSLTSGAAAAIAHHARRMSRMAQPQRTHSEAVRDQLNHDVDRQVSCVINGPFPDALREKLINVRTLSFACVEFKEQQAWQCAGSEAPQGSTCVEQPTLCKGLM